MNSNRGFTLIEVMAALAIMAIAVLGLTGAMIVAVNSNAIASQRTVMAQFAQTRLERLVAETRTKVPTSNTTLQNVNCCSQMAVGGTFDPNVPPGTGGWMIDVIDGAAPAGAGNDVMFGPVLMYDSASNATDTFLAQTQALRTSVLNAWNAGSLTGGCANAAVQGAGVLCREIHIEPQTLNGVPMLRVWVRVLRSGASWAATQLVMQEDIAQ